MKAHQMKKRSTRTQFMITLGHFLLAGSALGGMNVLVIGSSESYSEIPDAGMVHEKAFAPSLIASELQNILAGDPSVSGAVHVVTEDISRNKIIKTAFGTSLLVDFKYHVHSLVQYYFWPEGRTNRLANLGSAAGTNWDYVVIMDDPYLLGNIPGIHAEGVRLICDAAASGGAQPILLGQWPEADTTAFNVAHFNEISYRVGNGLDIPVVPAALAWDSLAAEKKESLPTDPLPTPNGAYLAASAIYSEMTGRSAGTSSYLYDDVIADHAYSTITNAAEQTCFPGTFLFENPFSMAGASTRHIDFNQTGTSSESGIRSALESAMTRCRVSYTEQAGLPETWPPDVAPADLNYGRANTHFEPEKRYAVDTNHCDRSYGFPMQDAKVTGEEITGKETMLYGMDKRYLYTTTHYDGTDMGTGTKMIRLGEVSLGARTIPIRFMWAQMHDISPALSPYKDNDDWHMSPYLNEASGTFMYTLHSGRCPLEDEPSPSGTDAWHNWLGRKVGYETAWRMAHLKARVPGFKVLPGATAANVAGIESPAMITVRFLYPPRSNVTVNITFSNPAQGQATPTQLIFTPANYALEQTVTLSTLSPTAPTAISSAQFTTASDDPAFDGLQDAWQYTFEGPNKATLPFQDDFEAYPAGEPARTNGWEGLGQTETADYSATYTEAYPLPNSTHTQVLNAKRKSLFIDTQTDLTELWFDSVVQFTSHGDPSNLYTPTTALAYFSVDTNRCLNVFHGKDNSGSYTNIWTPLIQTSISTQQWVRLTLEVSYAHALQPQTFFKLHVNGSQALTSPEAYLDRSDPAPSANGTWFPAANSSMAGNELEVRMSHTQCDDIVLSTNAAPVGDTLDRDNDGMPDWWESRYHLNPVEPSDATADSDQDGSENYKEYLAGTTPDDSTSVLAINSLTPATSGLLIKWNSVSNRIYSIHASTNLLSGLWTPVSSNLPSTPPKNSHAIIPTEKRMRFFKICTEHSRQ